MFYGHSFIVLCINTEWALLFSSIKPPEAETHQFLSTEGWKCQISLLAVPSAMVSSRVKSSPWPSPAAHKSRLFGRQSRGISCSCIRAAQGLSAFTKVPLDVKHECSLLAGAAQITAGGSLRAEQVPCIQRQSSSAMCYTALPEYRDEDAATRGSQSGLQAADKNWKLSRLGALSPTSWLSSFASCRPPGTPSSHKAALAESPV